MASKLDMREVKELLRLIPVRQVVRLLPILFVAVALAWFFVARSPGDQTNTSGTSDTTGKPPETTVNTAAPAQQPEEKVADNSASLSGKPADEEGKEGKMPEAGPADTLAIFAVATVAGTLFWEWRLRRIANQKRNAA